MDTKLLELLVCPVTKGPLTWNPEKQELVSRSARLAYPVRDGIPVLLENEARTLSDEELGPVSFTVLIPARLGVDAAAQQAAGRHRRRAHGGARGAARSESGAARVVVAGDDRLHHRGLPGARRRGAA